MPLTEIAHEAWADRLRPGSCVLDATAGNGFDTLFLARHVGPEGRVFAVDIQASAVTATRTALTQAGLSDRAEIRQGDHTQLGVIFPDLHKGQLDLVCFNLGYLPGGDHSITTKAESTLAGLEACLDLLSDNGALSVIAYRGHPGAVDEHAATAGFFSTLPAPWRCLCHIETGSAEHPGPVWWFAAQSA
jgi:tRNA1(Val) A37 N6-methylase TrmN6